MSERAQGVAPGFAGGAAGASMAAPAATLALVDPAVAASMTAPAATLASADAAAAKPSSFALPSTGAVSSASLSPLATPPLTPASRPVLSSEAIARPAPLVFGSERSETPFPAAGAMLLVLLLGVAAWAWWQAQRRGGGLVEGGFNAGPGTPTRQRRWRWFSPLISPPSISHAARVLTTTRLDVHGCLHVVEWHGEQWLLAVNGATSPVVIARRPNDVAGEAGAAP